MIPAMQVNCLNKSKNIFGYFPVGGGNNKQIILWLFLEEKSLMMPEQFIFLSLSTLNAHALQMI